MGGLVRVTGAGMGCPDWPKCFGEWIPPTSEAQLPDNYKEVYITKRKSKVERLITFLEKVGMHDKALKIQKKQGLFEPHVYSFSKAYTEYGNRLVGVLTGIFALLTVFFSVTFFKKAFWKMGFAFIGLFFIIYNGWLGSIVVDSNLFGGMVTIHFVIAFFAVLFFMLAFYHGKESLATTNTDGKRLLWISLALVLGIVQLISGTLVREQAEILAGLNTIISINNFELLGSNFNLHRLTAPILAVIIIWVLFKNRNIASRKKINTFYLACLILLLLQVLTGVLNVRFNFPPMAQLAHVVLGSVLLTGLIFISIHEFKVKTSS